MAVAVLPAATLKVVRLRLQVLNNDWLTGADVETIDLDALSEEERYGLFILNLDMRIHLDALPFPEFIEVLLTQPLGRGFRVVRMGGCDLNALVMFNVGHQLLIADHSFAEKAELMT